MTSFTGAGGAIHASFESASRRSGNQPPPPTDAGGSGGLTVRGQSPDSGDAGIPIDSPLFGDLGAYDDPIYEQHSLDDVFNPGYSTGDLFGSGPDDIFQDSLPPFVTADSIFDDRWNPSPAQHRSLFDGTFGDDVLFTSFTDFEFRHDGQQAVPTEIPSLRTTATEDTEPFGMSQVGTFVFRAVTASGRAFSQAFSRQLHAGRETMDMLNRSPIVDPIGSVFGTYRSYLHSRNHTYELENLDRFERFMFGSPNDAQPGFVEIDGVFYESSPVHIGTLPAPGLFGRGAFGRTPVIRNSAARTMGPLKGTSEHQIRVLRDRGFTRTGISNSVGRNETWTHPDGSEIRIHPYGNLKQAPYRSANNAHVHKQDPLGYQLNDRGVPSADPAETHIGIPNPPDLPAVRGRPHGAGTQ